MVQIRLEDVEDYGAVTGVIEKVFAASDMGYHGEAELVEKLRGDDSFSLVAELAGRIVGQIFYSPVLLESDQHMIKGMGLGPISVVPELQREGVGSLLVNESIRRLEILQTGFLAVLGCPDFYPRFGFELAQHYHINHGFDGINQGFFMIKPMAILPADLPAGVVLYQDAFGIQSRDLAVGL